MIDIFPDIPLFSGLEAAQIELLKPLFEQVVFQPGETIIKQGDPADYLYFIVRGNAAIHYKPYDGPSMILSHLRVSDVFGWSAIIGNERYTSSIVSETNMFTVRALGKDLIHLAKTYPRVGKIIMERLAQSVSPRWHHNRQRAKRIKHPS